MLLDIPGDDPALYLTACEDGTIHKCLDAYAEQYLNLIQDTRVPCIKSQLTLRPQGVSELQCGLDREVVDASFVISISIVPERRVVSTK